MEAVCIMHAEHQAWDTGQLSRLSRVGVVCVEPAWPGEAGDGSCVHHAEHQAWDTGQLSRLSRVGAVCVEPAWPGQAGDGSCVHHAKHQARAQAGAGDRANVRRLLGTLGQAAW